jgi:hypothetical protein
MSWEVAFYFLFFKKMKHVQNYNVNLPSRIWVADGSLAR